MTNKIVLEEVEKIKMENIQLKMSNIQTQAQNALNQLQAEGAELLNSIHDKAGTDPNDKWDLDLKAGVLKKQEVAKNGKEKKKK